VPLWFGLKLAIGSGPRASDVCAGSCGQQRPWRDPRIPCSFPRTRPCWKLRLAPPTWSVSRRPIRCRLKVIEPTEFEVWVSKLVMA